MANDNIPVIFEPRSKSDQKKALDPLTHIYCGGARCQTESRGYPTPQNKPPVELVVDATNGFIPLWAEGVTLNWRFQETALAVYKDPEAVKDYVRTLFGESLLAWGSAVPVRFSETQDPWDFEMVVSEQAACNAAGCVLASAFFPDSGQHELTLFPTMFEQSRKEQIETMAHELGHVFGLRHFFAQVDEATFPSEIYGDHDKFTIMNYGPDSQMTATDQDDLATLYDLAWSGDLTHINGTPIKLVRPYSEFYLPVPPAGVFTKKGTGAPKSA